jgi:hypothetical protein
MPSFLNPLLRNPGIPHVLVNARTGAMIARQLLTAFDSASRRKGLLGRESLAEGTALIIAPSNAVHTFFMRFPIDVATQFRSAVPPSRCARMQSWKWQPELSRNSTPAPAAPSWSAPNRTARPLSTTL